MMISNNYRQWRSQILTIRPEQVGQPANGTQVYGVIMDIGMIDTASNTPWAISLSAFSTGEASFYPSPGGGVSGLGGDPQVAQMAQEIITSAQSLQMDAASVTDVSLPDPGFVRFLFFTPGGLRQVQGHLQELQTPNHPLLPLLNRFGRIRQFADQVIDQQRSQSSS